MSRPRLRIGSRMVRSRVSADLVALVGRRGIADNRARQSQALAADEPTKCKRVTEGETCEFGRMVQTVCVLFDEAAEARLTAIASDRSHPFKDIQRGCFVPLPAERPSYAMRLAKPGC